MTFSRAQLRRNALGAASVAGQSRRMTRREAQAWLAPVRAAFSQMLQGEADAIRGYAVTRLHHKDDWARTDQCIAGFRGLMARLMPELQMDPLARVEKKLAAGVLLQAQELQACLALFKGVEDRLTKLTRAQVMDAAQTEQIAIELELRGLVQEVA